MFNMIEASCNQCEPSTCPNIISVDSRIVVGQLLRISVDVTFPDLAIEILVNDERDIRIDQSRVVETAVIPDGALLVDTSGFEVDVNITFRFIRSTGDIFLYTAGSFHTIGGE